MHMSLNLQVSKVFYPGLPDAPRSALVQELFTDGGAGGMLSFEVKGGVDVAEAVTRVRRLAVLAQQRELGAIMLSEPCSTARVDCACNATYSSLHVELQCCSL
jgi:O-acetylhomoserine/O-acetylserine sulfhydrylase-like pyridoxal-dependent enzyme